MPCLLGEVEVGVVEVEVVGEVVVVVEVEVGHRSQELLYPLSPSPFPE